MLDPIFYFARENHSSSTVSDQTLADFARFSKNWGLSESDVLKDREFIRVRLQYTLTLGSSGLRSAKQQMLAADPQVSAAVKAMSKAAAFVRTPSNRNLSVK